MLSHHFTRVCGGLLLVGLLALSAGCGSSSKAKGSVKGKISFGGKTLTTGSVMFYRSDGVTASATIDKNGDYEMADAPVGEVKVTVTVPKPPPGGTRMTAGAGARGGKDARPQNPKDAKSQNPEEPGQSISIMGDMPTHVVLIPEKYSSVDTSGLTYTVQKGEQTHDINLTP